MNNRLMVQEGQLLAVFNSGHRVMKAENLLKSHNMGILLIPAPRQLQTDCGLAIRFNEQDHDAVMSVLEKNELLPEFLSRFNGTDFTIIWKYSLAL